jgi:hypothetical protein
VVVSLAGCTQVLDDAQARKQQSVGPIAAAQVSDLLSEDASPDADRDLFADVEPQECAGLAREVRPPFIFDVTPAAHDGGQHFIDDEYYSVQEMVAVYPTGFRPAAAVAEVRRTIADCTKGPLVVTAASGDQLRFRSAPGADAGTPEIVLWTLHGSGRACDNAFIAAYNAAVEMTACGKTNGADIAAMAHAALKRIDALANATV